MYKLKSIIWCLSISSLAFLTSCSEPSSKGALKLSSSHAQSLYNEGKLAESSDLYARVGEALISSPNGGIFLAEEMFQKSLSIDSTNSKANFYSAILAPQMTMKGFVPRFKKLSNDKISINKFENEISELGLPEVTDFYLKLKPGAVEAKELEDLRRFVRNEYAKELKNSLAKISLISGKNFKILPVINEEKTQICEVDSSGNAIICKDEEVKQKAVSVYIDEHDVKALKVSFSAMRSALLLSTSIGLKGVEEVSRKLEQKKQSSKKVSDKEIVDLLKTRPDFLRFEGSKNDLREIFLAKEEIIEDLIDFSKVRSELCDKSLRKNNLVKEICIDAETADRLSEVLTYIVGPKEILLGYDEDGREVSVEVNLRALVDSELTSLQDLLPNKFSKEGKILELKDPTFAGMIPNGDLLQKLKIVNSVKLEE